MKMIQSRLAAVVLGVAGAVACTGVAQAQCSSWANTLGIAAYLGGEAVLINTTLSNDSAFVFWASSIDEFVAFTVDYDGVKELKNWAEDAYGTGVLADNTGQVCTIECDTEGGIILSIEGNDFDTLSWHIKADGGTSMPGDVCGCSGSASAPAQTVVCNLANCNAYAACRPAMSGYCQTGTLPN